MGSKRVLSLGQCAADHSSISRLLRDQFGADVVPAHSPREAMEELARRDYALVLVNRLLNAGGSGLDFITRLKSNELTAQLPVMLVSDRADAQQQAVAGGALPGFGKSALRSPATVRRLAAVLGDADDSDDGAAPGTQSV
jgi:CheY-like chemotaxis protein